MKTLATTYYEEIWKEAVEAGHKALIECKPTPVAFYEADLFTDEQIGPSCIVEEGDCGGAYLIISGKGDFALFAKAKLGADKNYGGTGLHLSCFDAHSGYRGQSAERYEACANAMAEVLNSNGIQCRVRAYLT